jgi:UDP-N-acetylglucosamine 1-carboxyvinyltransferase
MGAEFTIRHGDVHAVADRLHGADITLDFPSVGATENLVTAAVFAKGTTTIDNAAREPEIVDLCNMLVAMGASIDGIGSSTIGIHGVERDALRPTSHAVIPDRVQAATYVAAAAITGGEVLVRGAVPEHMEMLLRRFNDMGCLSSGPTS